MECGADGHGYEEIEGFFRSRLEWNTYLYERLEPRVVEDRSIHGLAWLAGLPLWSSISLVPGALADFSSTRNGRSGGEKVEVINFFGPGLDREPLELWICKGIPTRQLC